MPQWDTADLPRAPRITLRSWALLIGPGLVAAGAAIGGGEWLAGPLTTARYGGAILWLATISILVQVVYNLEICRYTLYSGEPIFTGKFRVLPGPLFWLVIYVFLDFGSVFPYLVANAATPLGAVILGEIPDVDKIYHVMGLALTGKVFLRFLTYVVFIMSLVPLIFGGKVYNSLKAVMSFKIAVVFGFLLLVAVLYSTPDTWADILSGFFKFGTVPVVSAESSTGPPVTENVFLAWWHGNPLPKLDFSMIALLGALAAISGNGGLTNTALSGYARDQGWGMGQHVGAIPSIVGGRKLTLCHVGSVFPINAESVERFRHWYRFLLRDQLIVWMPACFVGVALPSMLSVQFLPARHASSRLDRSRHDRRRPAPRRRPTVRHLFLVNDTVLRLPRARPSRRHHVRWGTPPLGRSVLDRCPLRPPLGFAPHPLALFRCRLRLRGLRPHRTFVMEPEGAARLGHVYL